MTNKTIVPVTQAEANLLPDEVEAVAFAIARADLGADELGMEPASDEWAYHIAIAAIEALDSHRLTRTPPVEERLAFAISKERHQPEAPAASAVDEVGRLREACIPDWPSDVVLPNGGLLFMEGNITSDTHPFSVGALRPDKTLLWEKRYVNFRTARQHFDRCVAGLATNQGGSDAE